MELVMLIVSVLSFISLGFCYFFARFKLCILLLVVFYISSIMFAHGHLYGVHNIIFYLILTIAVIIPSLGLIAFAFDARYGIFCTDTSFSIVFAWFLSPLILL
ncbi:MAG TPA: hypothetical protein VI387_08890 [Candidatus Brocadiales bacterium]|nr:hypothetical protein [Candidatus Brocadiales bacterium]